MPRSAPGRRRGWRAGLHERDMRPGLPGAGRHPGAAGGRSPPPRGGWVTVDAQERLDTMALLAAADPSDMLRQVASSAAQVRTAVRATQDADLDEIIAAGRPRAIVVTGMGGSGTAAGMLAPARRRASPAQT